MSCSNGSRALAPLITVLVLLLLYVYRRFVSHRPWSGLGMTLTWRALPQALLGMAVGLAALLAANAVSVWAGAATWQPPAGDRVASHDPCRHRPDHAESLVPGGTAVPRPSVRHAVRPAQPPRRSGDHHGVLRRPPHPVESPASGIAEKILYAVQATALGLLCGAARARTGAVWMAVGAHTSIYVSSGAFPTQEIDYAAQLTLQTAALVLAAVLVLRFPSGPTGRAPTSKGVDLGDGDFGVAEEQPVRWVMKPGSADISRGFRSHR